MDAPLIETLRRAPMDRRRIELVERKGIGHPDTLCDALMEQIAADLCRVYQERFGRVLHYNLDKALLVAGRAEPQFGGGVVLEPMRLVIGDRATSVYRGERIDIGALAEASAADWLRTHLRFVVPEQHLVLQNELRAGAPELTDLFERPTSGANDTSAAVGYAPLSATEQLVLAAERFLNAPDLKRLLPVAGEDIKVMAYRRDRRVDLTVAVAFVDRYVHDAASYFAQKALIQTALTQHLAVLAGDLELRIALNTLDDRARGAAGMYLTVLGTSAESGDSGQVGRGNRVNGLIAFNRPQSTEAAAGKNPTRHVGKIYSLLSQQLADEIYRDVAGLQEVYIWLGSQIGRPIDQPALAAAQLILAPGAALADVRGAVAERIQAALANLPTFISRLAQAAQPVY